MTMHHSRFCVLAFAGVLLLPLAGCKPKQPSDEALAASIQSQLSGDSALAGQPLHAAVAGSVVTLSGAVLNDAQRSIAARDAAGVNGVHEVVNNLSIGAVSASTSAPQAAPLAVPVSPTPAVPVAQPAPTSREARRSEPVPLPTRMPAPIERRNGGQNYNTPQQSYQPPVPQAPPPPPQPTFRNVTVASGAGLNVRMTQTLDSATTQPGTSFSGVLSSDVLVDGLVALPAGSAVTGTVTDVHEAAHFKGSSLLAISLTSVRRRGDTFPVTTEPYSVEGKGRGKNTAVKTGGGAAVGAVLGGIFGGGKGAAIGAGAGAGVGAGSNAITRGQQVQIDSESIVRFQLTSPITVKVRTDAPGAPGNQDPNLQHHPNTPSN